VKTHRINGLRLCDAGSGEPALVFLHGLGSDLDAWRDQVTSLSDARRCIAYDQRGHGGSAPARDGVYTIDALAEDLHALVSQLAVTRCVLVGHSMSGMVITAYAGAHPERVAGLVYADAIGDFLAFPRTMLDQQLRLDAKISADARLRRTAYEEILSAAARPATREHALASAEAMHGPAFASLRRSGAEFDARARMGNYRGPILAIETEDNRFPAVASRVLGIERKALANASHWLMMDEPEAFNTLLREWLERLGL
jgi:pimeloyl-ACP methyl ester carboxylesterase